MESRRREEALHEHVASLEAERSFSRGLDESTSSAMSAEQVSDILSRLEESQHGQQQLEHEKEQLRHERDLLRQEREVLREERDKLHSEKHSLSSQVMALESSSQSQRADSDTQKKTVERFQKRIAELEGTVVELSRRERHLEDQINQSPNPEEFAAERERWEQERRQFDAEREQWEADRQQFSSERSHWGAERAEWQDERKALDVKLTKHAQLISEFADARRSWEEERERLVEERSQWHSDRSAVQDIQSLLDAERAKWAADREALAAEREHDRAQWIADQRTEQQAWEAQLDKWEHERAELEQALNRMELERDTANGDRELSFSRHDALASRHDELRSRHDALQDEYTQLRAVHDEVLSEHTQLRSTHSKLQSEHVRALDDAAATSNVSKTMAKKTTMALASILGKLVPEDELGEAAVEVRQVFEKQSTELVDLRDHLHEVTRGLEEEVRRVTTDRDDWRAKADSLIQQHDGTVASSREQQNEMTELVRKIRAQNEKVVELQHELQQAQQQSSRALSASSLSPDVASLSQAWALLPSPRARTEAGLTDPNVVSPSSQVNFGALQRAYSSQSSDGFPGTKGLVERIRGVVDDGRLMAERMARMEQDKEKHKQNAARAAKLVEESQRSLATYQKQVKDLQVRLQLATGSPITSPVLSPTVQT